MILVPFVRMRVPVASHVMVLQEKVCPAVRRSTWDPVVICRVVREGLRTVRGSSSSIVLEMVAVTLVMRVERGERSALTAYDSWSAPVSSLASFTGATNWSKYSLTARTMPPIRSSTSPKSTASPSSSLFSVPACDSVTVMVRTKSKYGGPCANAAVQSGFI